MKDEQRTVADSIAYCSSTTPLGRLAVGSSAEIKSGMVVSVKLQKDTTEQKEGAGEW